MEKEKVKAAVMAAEKRIIENKVSLREKQRKFDELMAHNDQKGLRALEIEIRHLNRLNGINHKLIREQKAFERQKSKVSIRGQENS